jgi:hypothetical protein
VSVLSGLNANVGFNPVSPDLMYIFIVRNTPEPVRLPENQLPAAVRERLEGYVGLVARVRDKITENTHVIVLPAEAILVPQALAPSASALDW